MTDEWGKPGFAKNLPSSHAMTDILGEMKLQTRQLLYGLALKKTFKRGTWNGCVMNVATDQHSAMDAASRLGEDVRVIARFIRRWDRSIENLTEQQAQEWLITCLLSAGVVEGFERPTPIESDPSIKVHRVRLYTSEEDAAVEKFREEIESGALDSLLAEFDDLVLV